MFDGLKNLLSSEEGTEQAPLFDVDTLPSLHEYVTTVSLPGEAAVAQALRSMASRLPKPTAEQAITPVQTPTVETNTEVAAPPIAAEESQPIDAVPEVTSGEINLENSRANVAELFEEMNREAA